MHCFLQDSSLIFISLISERAMTDFYNINTYDYDLPEELIAQMPLTSRTQSRLLCVNGMNLAHKHFSEVIDLINPGDLLVLNNTKVIPARMFGAKKTGGKIECLLERIVDDKTALVMLRSSKSPKIGSELIFDEGVTATVIDREADLFKLEFSSSKTVLKIFESLGHMPLPPYIEREDNENDKSRYQTVFAKKHGAVAAPTAGLHFDDALLQKLKDKGVFIKEITLHVGAGTFQPVRVDDIREHHMHGELIEVSQDIIDSINDCKKRGGNIIAVGTTVVRALESAAQTGELKPFVGETDIFIYPGFEFKVIDKLITNFHLPKSTLLMLVSAFAGYDAMMQAYRCAVAEKYRFFSYGDAMLLEKCN